MKKTKQFLKCAGLTYLLGAILTPTPTLVLVLFLSLQDYLLGFSLDILSALLLVIIVTILVFFILRAIALKLLKLCRQLQMKKVYIMLSGIACFLLGAYTWIIVLTQFILS